MLPKSQRAPPQAEGTDGGDSQKGWKKLHGKFRGNNWGGGGRGNARP